jgi:hypothetical protein
MKALFDQTKYTKWYITNTGKIITFSTYRREGKLREVKPNINKKRGYMYARTSNKNYIISRLVASAFIPNPENKPTVNHKDGDKHNNHVSNLEWATYKENNQHAINNGLTRKICKNEGNLKYTIKECRDVLRRVKSGLTYIKAGEPYKMPYSTVAHLVRGSRRSV